MANKVTTINTKPFDGQKPGTSGLRKRVKVFQQESIFDAISPQGKTLVIGGDGRYFSEPTVQSIIKISAANDVKKLIIGKDGILSTPAASNIIRKYKADGGILLTASHNPGGPDNDFGIKYNVSNGGPAPENVTDSIYAKTKTINSYKILEGGSIDLSKVTSKPIQYGPTQITIIDSVTDYIELVTSIFDFDLIKSFLQNTPSFKVLFDGLNGVTGPYAKAIFLNELSLPESSLQNCVPLPDFGGSHPDPNLTYAHSLVEAVEKGKIPFGAASDGDGDRNMIYGAGAFVTPSDSVAIIADWAEVIPYFKKGGIKGLARSMPTSEAIDHVAKKKGLQVYEVPTGWKFFGNLMDAGRLSICGEESFGTGSDHIREKDGLWAVVAWLNIIAAANLPSHKHLFSSAGDFIGINDILQRHYKTHGRSFFTRYDYEELPSEDAQKVIDALNAHITNQSLNNTTHTSESTKETFTVARISSFTYTDPIDNSVSKNQGHIISFTDGSRVVFRLSGTGSQGATVRVYIEKYTKDETQLNLSTADGLGGLIQVALNISYLVEFTGRKEPTVITNPNM
ncbi:hypothetical protein Clacol_005797 [Clathrus columnatus]|uniref:phosphoglucomutase (alpha-D-glucose-1,6-bisphosphate-dependent) n=1 Tax=Clathrus columnatus TaxID=1419009 RepID=A0AAV5AFX3_9AGAM|nr:hypothetical protein Clacol_005797 [Clathrus columnatus]